MRRDPNIKHPPQVDDHPEHPEYSESLEDCTLQ